MTASMHKTPGWLDWYPDPTIPEFVMPTGSVDAHCHVFGPSTEFPFAAERKYTPCDASKNQLFTLRDRLGVSRNIVVQATCHGADNSAMVDAVLAAGDAARGVATVRPSVTDSELRRLHDAGVRGVRFNFLKRLVNTVPEADLLAITRRIEPLGWHIVVYFEASELADLEGFFGTLPVPIVVDHMGRPDVTAPSEGPEFDRFLRFVDRNDAWVKVSCPERLTAHGPPALDGERVGYTDVLPFEQKIVTEFPDSVLWGSDWPHPNLTDHMPDDGLIVERIPVIAPTREAQHKLLVDNPMRLYWPDETV